MNSSSRKLQFKQLQKLQFTCEEQFVTYHLQFKFISNKMNISQD